MVCSLLGLHCMPLVWEDNFKKKVLKYIIKCIAKRTSEQYVVFDHLYINLKFKLICKYPCQWKLKMLFCNNDVTIIFHSLKLAGGN